jgi:6-phospho-3-hexuloisomerase
MSTPLRLSAWIRHDLDEVNAILAQLDDAQTDALLDAIGGARRVFVLGLGRSGLLLRMFAMRLMQIGLTAHIVGDATTPAIAPGDLLIALSGSGRTATVLTLAHKAKGIGAQVAAVTSSRVTPLAELADLVVILPAGSVKSDVTTPTRLPLANALEQAMSIYLDCVGAMLAAHYEQDNAAMMARHANLE